MTFEVFLTGLFSLFVCVAGAAFYALRKDLNDLGRLHTWQMDAAAKQLDTLEKSRDELRRIVDVHNHGLAENERIRFQLWQEISGLRERIGKSGDEQSPPPVVAPKRWNGSFVAARNLAEQGERARARNLAEQARANGEVK